MKIQKLPKFDRPREKLIRYGQERLSNAELLAVILGKGKKDKNAIELAKELLREFPDKKWINITLSELKIISGIGDVKASQILSCLEFCKRVLKGKKAVLILSPKDVWEELKDVRSSKKENFYVFYLDVRNQVINKDLISIGTLNMSLVHPREVFESAIKNSAAQIILSHNHPSGEVKPSEEDIDLTKRLIKAGDILGIEVIDHVIVSNFDYFSMKENKVI
jgi:DNA repair protein RadC